MAKPSEQVDPRITAAAAHWSHRMVTNGVPLADFQDVTTGITQWDDWCAAWVVRGKVHDGLGDTAEGEGRLRSAAEPFRDRCRLLSLWQVPVRA